MTASPDFYQPNPLPQANSWAAGGTPEPISDSKARGRSVRGEDFTDLRIWAESLEDVMKARISVENRAKRGGVDYDLFAADIEALKAREHAFGLALRQSARRIIRSEFPGVEVWAKSHFGIGMDRLLPRLLGSLGHPVIATPYMWTDDKPDGHECIEGRCGKRHLVALEPYRRTLRQLWSYCGHGEALRRSKGMSQDEALGLGSPRCKMLVHLLAEATIKCGPQPTRISEATSLAAGAITHSPPTRQAEAKSDPVGSGSGTPSAPAEAIEEPDKYRYRNIYDTRKAATADRGWTDGHRHNDALRIVGKEILRDLWLAAGGGR